MIISEWILYKFTSDYFCFQGLTVVLIFFLICGFVFNLVEIFLIQV